MDSKKYPSLSAVLATKIVSAFGEENGKPAAFVSPPGEYGMVPASELAMHTRIVDQPIVQYALFGEPGQPARYAHVKLADGRENHGLPGEVLSWDARNLHGGENTIIPVDKHPSLSAVLAKGYSDYSNEELVEMIGKEAAKKDSKKLEKLRRELAYRKINPTPTEHTKKKTTMPWDGTRYTGMPKNKAKTTTPAAVTASKLHCDGQKDCEEPVTYIDNKGWVYCQEHGKNRTGGRPSRKLSPAELAKLESGGTIKYSTSSVTARAEDGVDMVVLHQSAGGWWRLKPLKNNEPISIESFSPQTQKLAKKAFETSTRAHEVVQELFPHAKTNVTSAVTAKYPGEKVIFQTQDENYRILEVPTDDFTMEDLKGETYDRKVNPDIPEEQMAQEEKDFEQLVNDYGVYGYVLEKWNPVAGKGYESVDSVWGFVGPYDPKDERFNHYIVDEMKRQIPPESLKQ